MNVLPRLRWMTLGEGAVHRWPLELIWWIKKTSKYEARTLSCPSLCGLNILTAVVSVSIILGENKASPGTALRQGEGHPIPVGFSADSSTTQFVTLHTHTHMLVQQNTDHMAADRPKAVLLLKCELGMWLITCSDWAPTRPTTNTHATSLAAIIWSHPKNSTIIVLV